MREFRNLIHFSMITAAVCMATSASAAVRINNTSRPNRANTVQQMNAQINQQYMQVATPAPTPTVDDLPIRVANDTLANQIVHGDATNVDMNRLNSCAAIYPEGEFEWANPTVGARSGTGSTCSAVVEIRGYQMGAGGSDVVLARANLAAGDAVNCNISEFPSASYTADAENVVFPYDTEPTMDDVIAVMNEEQKQNAGIKIAASMLVGGIGGNIAGKAEPGKEGLMGGMIGGGKEKTKSTIIGMLGAGAVTAAATYSGKVAGDTIMAAGVNAAAGGVVGNMMGTGESVMRIEKNCKIPSTTGNPDDAEFVSCLWGQLVIGNPLDANTERAYFNISDGETTLICGADNKNCVEQELVSIQIGGADLTSYKNFDTFSVDGCTQCFTYDENADEMKGNQSTPSDKYVLIDSAQKPSQKISAAAANVEDTPFGMKQNEWNTYKSEHANDITIYGRGTNGELYALTSVPADQAVLTNFYPMTLDAGDGALIDLGNKARLKATLTGAGAGAALGAFTGYQGATSEVEERWVSAVREYKDSLQKIYCATGNRFLGYYNSMVQIPTMIE